MLIFIPLLLIILFVWLLRLIGIIVDRRQLASQFGRHAFRKVTKEVPAQMRENIRIIQADSATEEEITENRQQLNLRFMQFGFDLGAIATFVPNLSQARSWDILKIAEVNIRDNDYEALMGNIDIMVENVQQMMGIYREDPRSDL